MIKCKFMYTACVYMLSLLRSKCGYLFEVYSMVWLHFKLSLFFIAIKEYN